MATMLAYPRHGILLNPSPSSYTSPLPYDASPISPYQALPSAFGGKASQRNSLQLAAATAAAAGPSHETPRTAASAPTAAATAAQPSSSHSTPYGSPRAAPRKIRFAPLPDPRRAVYVTDDGEELPLYSLSSSDGSADSVNEPAEIAAADGRQSPKGGSPAADDGATPLASQSPWSTPATTPAASPFPTTSALAPAAGYVDYVPTPSSPFLSKTKKLFKPLFPSRLPEMKLNVSTEDVLTLGTINLFRTSSRDSNATPRASGSRASSRERAQSDDEVLGAPLGRSTSAGSGRGKKGAKKGVPFRRTQSYDTEAAGAPQRPGSSGSGMQGQRMLNGRVYGAKRNAQRNPFANIPDREPEFVEWGYGGMGSVKAAKDAGAGSMLWAPLQQNAQPSVGSHSQDDEDDGSGMAWIRRRREQREREEKERKEREASSAPSTAPSSAGASPAPVEAPLPESASQVSTPKGEPPHAAHHTGESSEYLHTTLCLRPPVARHRSMKECTTMSPSSDGLAPVVEGGAELPARELDEATDATSSPSSGSPSDSVEDVSEADGSEEEEAAADQARVTAKGASVEFISKRKRT